MSRPLLIFAFVLAAIVRVSAHPASDTSVVITFRDRQTIEIAVAADAAALVAKLDAFAGTQMPAPVPQGREALAARLSSLGMALANHAVLTVNGVRLTTQPGSVLVDDRGLGTMHLEGTVAGPATTLTWSTDLMWGSYPLVLRGAGGGETIYWLDGQRSSGPIAADRLTQPATTIWSGIWIGFTHIIPKGLDHILFVLGLFLLSPGLKQLVWQVSAFTVAHTVTLGLSLYGIVSAPGNIVEPLIALSVAYVGVENLFTSRLQPWRVVIVFAFGLLHGLGFAGAMSELPYSKADLVGMLVSFNVGVELGQLFVIAGAALLMRMAIAYRGAWQRPIAQLASAAVGIAGLLWTVERL